LLEEAQATDKSIAYQTKTGNIYFKISLYPCDKTIFTAPTVLSRCFSCAEKGIWESVSNSQKQNVIKRNKNSFLYQSICQEKSKSSRAFAIKRQLQSRKESCRMYR
jgi:hypothetical protein